MRKSILSMVITIVLSLVCVFSGYAQDKNEIVIGSIWSQVGIAAPLGQAGLRGSQLSVDRINAQGGIFGYPVKLYNIDGQSDQTVISNAAIRLTEEIKVVAVCGLTDDSLVSAAGPIFQSHKTPFLDGTATTPTITEIGDYIFMTPFGDNDQGRAVAKYAVKLGYKKAATIKDNASAYSIALTGFFEESFKEFTGDPNAIVLQETYQTGDEDYTAQLTRIRLRRKDIDVIVIVPPFPKDGPVIAKQARKLGIDLPLILTDGADDVTLTEVGGEAVEGAIVSTHFSISKPGTTVGEEFVKMYREKHGSDPGAFESLGFDAVQLIIGSIQTIGKEKWDSYSLEQRRTAIRDTLQAEKFTNTTAPISFPDPATAKYPRVPQKPVVFLEVKDGQRVYRETLPPEEFK